MKFMESDMAGYAESIALATPPGSAWNYHDGNTVILSHLIRNATGGRASGCDAVRAAGIVRPARHAQRHDRVRRVGQCGRIEPDAGERARLGALRQLYLNDGVAGGKRILPEGWVKYSASPTPNAWVGQGAGFWTNLGDSFGATYRTERGWPRDAFFAKGTIGQYVIIVPSERLVIVRLGRSPNWPPEADGVFDLVRDVVAATGSKGKLAGSELTHAGSPRSPDGAKRMGIHRGGSDPNALRSIQRYVLNVSTAVPTAWPSRRDRIAPATGSRRRAGRRGRSAPGGRA